MKASTLAIVIPAYKPDFLQRTLESIAAQTCNDFTVYIGDDCSPSDLKSIVSPFADRINLVYKRFETNEGSEDLVAHWERCIRLSSEQWIWLFSDDDLLPEDAVERFYKAIAAHPEASFFRLPLCTIDEDDNIINAPLPFSASENSAQEYLMEYFITGRSSAACEYIFRRELFDSLEMVHFPCAWCSDIATWYSYANKAGNIVNIEGAPAYWRNAPNVNISSTRGLYEKKLEATTKFISWLSDNCTEPVDKPFKRAVRTYIETILNVSLEGNYSDKDLRTLVRAFSKLSPERAFRLYIKYKNRHKK